MKKTISALLLALLLSLCVFPTMAFAAISYKEWDSTNKQLIDTTISSPEQYYKLYMDQ